MTSVRPRMRALRPRLSTVFVVASTLMFATADAAAESTRLEPALVLVEVGVDRDVQGLALSFYRQTASAECAPEMRGMIVDKVTIASHLAMGANETRTFSVVVPGYSHERRSRGTALPTQCIALQHGSSFLSIVTLRKGVWEREPKFGSAIPGVEIVATTLLELDHDFVSNLWPEEPQVLDLRHVDAETRVRMSSMLDDIDGCSAPLVERRVHDYFVCRKNLFIVDTRPTETLVILKDSGALVAELRPAETLERYTNRPVPLSAKAGWQKRAFRLDTRCTVPAGEIAITDASGRTFDIPVAPGQGDDLAPTAYLPDEKRLTGAGRLAPFKATLTFPRDWRWGLNPACLKLESSQPEIVLGNTSGERISLAMAARDGLLSEGMADNLAVRVRRWALGQGSVVRIAASRYWAPSQVVPRVDSDRVAVVLDPVEWRRFKFEGRDRQGTPLSFARWRLVTEADVVALDDNATVALYRVPRARSFRLEPPDGFVFGDYEPVRPRVEIGATELEDAVLVRKILDVDLRARRVGLRPSALHSLAPMLRVELQDSTVVTVIGEVGSAGSGDGRITVRPPAGDPCPDGASEIETCPSNKPGCRRVCLVRPPTDTEPRHAVAVRDLHAATPVGLSRVNRSVLADPRKRMWFADLFAETSVDARRQSFERVFGRSDYGVDLHAEFDSVVVVRRRTIDGRCQVSKLQPSPISDAFRIANGYARDGLEVWTDDGWAALSQVQHSTLAPVGIRHAYIVVNVNDMDLPASAPPRARGGDVGSEGKKFWDTVFRRAGDSSGVEREPEQVSAGLASFQRRWSAHAGQLFEVLGAHGVRTLAVYAAYSASDGFKFIRIGSPVVLDAPGARMQFLEMHVRLYEQRSMLQGARLDARPWGLCTSPRCVARAFERSLTGRCDFKPLSRLLIAAQPDPERPARGDAPSLLSACLIEGFAGRGADSELAFADCGFHTRGAGK